jgi:hypothetical protein
MSAAFKRRRLEAIPKFKYRREAIFVRPWISAYSYKIISHKDHKDHKDFFSTPLRLPVILFNLWQTHFHIGKFAHWYIILFLPQRPQRFFFSASAIPCNFI